MTLYNPSRQDRRKDFFLGLVLTLVGGIFIYVFAWNLIRFLGVEYAGVETVGHITKADPPKTRSRPVSLMNMKSMDSDIPDAAVWVMRVLSLPKLIWAGSYPSSTTKITPASPLLRASTMAKHLGCISSGR